MPREGIRSHRGSSGRGAVWLGFFAVLAASLVFQLILRGYPGSNSALPPDTSTWGGGYVGVAVQIEKVLNGTGPLEGHFLRTPGYPLLIYFAGRSAGIELADVVLPTRDWAGANDAGRALVHRVVLLQEILGFMIPPIIYLIVLSLGGSALLSSLVSSVYFLDTRYVAYQYVMMNETLTLFTMLLTILVFIRALEARSTAWIVICGFVTGLMLIVKPPLAVLVVILCGAAALILWIRGVGIRGTASWLAQYLVIAALLPLGWSAANYHGTGHFFYTLNATVTLQNFAARHFVQLEVDDPELLVLQRHAAGWLVQAAEMGRQDKETYAFFMTRHAVMAELGIDDPIYLNALASRANHMAVMHYPAEFLKGSVERFLMGWFRPFGNIKNRYALERLGDFGLPGRLLRFNGYMLFGPMTLPIFLLLVPIVAFRLPVETRIYFLSFAAFAILYSIATTMADENEPIRHVAQIRVIVNGMLVAGCCMLAREVWLKLRRPRQIAASNVRTPSTTQP